jgi:hypothetical protein
MARSSGGVGAVRRRRPGLPGLRAPWTPMSSDAHAASGSGSPRRGSGSRPGVQNVSLEVARPATVSAWRWLLRAGVPDSDVAVLKASSGLYRPWVASMLAALTCAFLTGWTSQQDRVFVLLAPLIPVPGRRPGLRRDRPHARAGDLDSLQQASDGAATHRCCAGNRAAGDDGNGPHGAGAAWGGLRVVAAWALPHGCDAPDADLVDRLGGGRSRGLWLGPPRACA